MSDSLETPWSDNPNAPKIPYWLYFGEKVYFAGSLIGAILYGIVIVLFFQCMSALLDPVNRARGGVKWGLVAHTVAMFSFVTIYISMTLHIQSISFIDNREFSGTSDDGAKPPGPLGYQWLIYSMPVATVPTSMIVLNNWLTDGLLLYRCCVVHAMNYWVMAFPCLMYLASIGTGILFTYQATRPGNIVLILDNVVHFGAPYFSVSFALNTLLTIMIVTRLILHRKNIRKVMGATPNVGEFYTTAVAIIVESSALNGICFLLYVGPWAAKSSVQYIFLQILAHTQVIAPFLITLRVANRRAPTNDTTFSGSAGPIQFNSRGKRASRGGTFPSVYSTSSTDGAELGVRVETVIDLHRDKTSGSEGTLET